MPGEPPSRRAGIGEQASHAIVRVGRAWRVLGREQRLAALGAMALIVALFLPWFQKSYFAKGVVINDSRNAFDAPFVAFAVMLVALGVLALLFARGERRGFHLPGGDGTVILAAGTWAALLILYRLFDKPSVSRAEAGATIGLEWGIFVALVTACALASAGARVRAAHRPEPPLPVAQEPAPPARPAGQPEAPSQPRAAAPDHAGGEAPTRIGEPPSTPERLF